jgi:polyisoprenoid-binding protein YceI
MTITTSTEQLTGTWAIDPAHSRLGFSVRHAGIATVRGSFTGFEGQLVLDGATPANSKASATVQAATFDTGNEQRDSHIKSPDFLDVEQYPTLTFASTEVRPDGDGYVVVGDLTIRGVTRPVEIAVEVEGQAVDPFGNTRVGFSGETQINRKDFGLTWNAALETGGVLVGDKVKITLDISAVKAAESAPETV